MLSKPALEQISDSISLISDSGLLAKCMFFKIVMALFKDEETPSFITPSTFINE